MIEKYRISYNFLNTPLVFNNNYITQAGRLYCTPSAIIAKHAHINWYELTIVTGGEGIVLTNDYPTKVARGDIYLSNPGDFHEIRSSEKNPLKYDFFAFHTANPELKSAFKEITENIYNFDERVFRDERVGNCVSQIVAELGSEEKYKNEIISSLTEQILYLVTRNFNSAKLKKVKSDVKEADELCFQIMHYIDTHIYSIKNLSQLSEIFSYNYSYLSNLFKSNTGITLLEYYQNRRLDTASLLLLENEFKINFIADKLNYSSLYSFSKAFKNKYGVSPRNYVKSQ